jgi:predicted  nucleic acid-binding Zn-ribbon protein
MREEEKASGIETELTQIEADIERIVEKEDAAQEQQNEIGKGKQRKFDEDKDKAEGMRRKAMEKLGETPEIPA